MMEMQRFLYGLNVVAQSFKLLKELHDDELEKSKDMMKLINETQLKVLKKISFIAKLHRHESSSNNLRLCYVVLCDGAKVLGKNGIHPSDYSITFRLADNVPKQGGVFDDCGVGVCIILYRLAHGVSLDGDEPVDVAQAYHEKMVSFILNTKLDQGCLFELGKVGRVVESDWRGGGVEVSGGEGLVRSGGKSRGCTVVV
nr:F-box domain-containing protein [Tanacetum cinerariifolium]